MARIVTCGTLLVLFLLCIPRAQGQTTPSSGGSYFIGVNGYNDQMIVHGVLDGDGYTKIVFDLGQAQMSGANYNVYIYANDVCTTAPAHWELYAYSGTELLPGRTFSGYFTGTPADVTPVTDIDEYNPITAGVSYELSASCHATGNQNFQMGATAGGVFELPTFGEGVATTPINAVEYTGKPQVCIADSPSACTTSVCEVSGASIDDRNSNQVISAGKTGSGCTWRLEITNDQVYLWTNIITTPIGFVGIQQGDAVSGIYEKLGILAPGKSEFYNVEFSEPGQAVNVFADLTGGPLDHAMLMNVVQAFIDGLSVGLPAGAVELSIEDAAEVLQTFAGAPHLTAAVQDFFRTSCIGSYCTLRPDVWDGLRELAEFSESSTERDAFAALLGQLGSDLLENSVTALLKTPGAIAAVLLEVLSNIDTAFFGNVAGSVMLTAQ